MTKLIPLGVLMVVASNTWAQENSDSSDGRTSVEVSGGFVGDFDDSGLWEDGYSGAVTALWWASESVHVAAGLGLTHWSYRPDELVASLVPSGATLLVEQSTGELEIVDLVPSVRWERDEIMPMRVGVFVQGGAGVAYVKTFALSEVQYDDGSGGPPTDLDFEIDQSDVYLEGVASAGFTRPMSTSSWLELFTSYRVIAADETADVFAVSVGFRVQM